MLMTTEEAAAYLRWHVVTVRKKASRGEIPFEKVGRNLRFRREVLDEWIAEGCPVVHKQPTLFNRRDGER